MVQRIHKINVLFGQTTLAPAHGKFLSATFIGDACVAHYLTEDEGLVWFPRIFIIVNLFMEDTVPDGYQFLGCFARNGLRDDALGLFVRV